MLQTSRKLTTINADFAAKHLPHPLRQRNRSETQVAKYAALIRQGKFLEGEDVPAIYLDESGYIIDGQHRVEAIRRSGVSLRLPVVFKASIERVATFVDQNRKRTVVDRAHMLGRADYSNDHHTINSFANADEHGMRANSVQSATFTEDAEVWLSRWDLIKGHYNELYKAFASRKDHSLKRKAVGVPIVMATLCRAMAKGADQKEVIEFWKAFINGNSNHAQSRYPQWLREIVLEYGAAISGSDQYRKALLFLTQLALNDFLTRKNKSSKYKLPIKEEMDKTGNKVFKLDAAKCANYF